MSLVASADRTAAVAVAALAAAFAVGGWQRVVDWRVSWPLVTFAGLLLASTFFSLRTFWAAIPPTFLQRVFDGSLLGLYLALAWQLHHPLRFTLVAAGLFACSVLKYRLAAPSFPYPAALRRKIFANSLGALWCLAAAGGILLGQPTVSAGIFALGFALATLHTTLLRPLYRLTPGPAR
jgi:hypothetical protein